MKLKQFNFDNFIQDLNTENYDAYVLHDLIVIESKASIGCKLITLKDKVLSFKDTYLELSLDDNEHNKIMSSLNILINNTKKIKFNQIVLTSNKNKWFIGLYKSKCNEYNLIQCSDGKLYSLEKHIAIPKMNLTQIMHFDENVKSVDTVLDHIYNQYL